MIYLMPLWIFINMIQFNNAQKYEDGLYLFNAKFYEEALEKFDSAPKFIKAITYFRVENYEESLKLLNQIDLKKYHFLKDEITYYKGNCYSKLENYEKSLEELQKISDDFILTKIKDTLLIETLLKLNKLSEIESLYQKYKDIKVSGSTDMDLVIELTHYLLLRNKPIEINNQNNKILKKIAKKLPINKKYNADLKRAVENIKIIITKNTTEKVWKKIKELKKEYNLIWILSNNQKTENCVIKTKYHRNKEANRCFKKFIDKLTYKKDKKDYCDAHFYNGYAFRKRRLHSDAINEFKKVMAVCKDYEKGDSLYYLAGVSSMYRKKNSDAINYFSKLYKNFPKSKLADDGINYIGFIYSKTKQYKKAQKIYLKQLKLFPKGDTTEDAIWKIAYNYYKMKNYKGYINFYEKAMKNGFIENNYYSKGRLSYWKAKSLEKLKKDKEAQKIYKEIVEKYHNNFYAFTSRMKYKGKITYKKIDIKKDIEKDIENNENIKDIENIGNRDEKLSFINYLKKEKRYEKIKFYASNHFLEFLMYEFNHLNKKDKIYIKYRREVLSFLIKYKAYYIPFWKKDLNFKWDSYDLVFEENIEFLKELYPHAYFRYIKKFSKDVGIDKYLAASIMREESYFHASIESWANAYGLMQIIEPTAKELAKGLKIKFDLKKLFIPKYNIRLGTKYLSWASRIFNKKLYYIIPSYNAGVNAVKRWKKPKVIKKDNKKITITKDFDEFIEDILYTETRKYTKRVLNTYFIYKRLYDNQFVILK